MELIKKDIRLYAAKMQSDFSLTHNTDAKRSCWIQVAKGNVTINAYLLAQVDRLGLNDIDAIAINSNNDSEFLLFDLPVQ